MEQEENVEGSDASFRSHLLGEIATELARAGESELASRAVEQVSDSSARNDATEIALAQARRFGLTSALQSVDRIGAISPGCVWAWLVLFFDGAGIPSGSATVRGTRKGRAWLSTRRSRRERHARERGERLRRPPAWPSPGPGPRCHFQRAGAGQGAQSKSEPEVLPKARWPKSWPQMATTMPPYKRRTPLPIRRSRLVLSARSVTLRATGRKTRRHTEDPSEMLWTPTVGTTGSKTTASPSDWHGPVTSRPRWGSLRCDGRSRPKALIRSYSLILPRSRLRAGDFPAARAVAEIMHHLGVTGAACRKMQHEGPGRSGPRAEAIPWAKSLKDPLHRSYALLGVAEGLAARRQRESQQKP